MKHIWCVYYIPDKKKKALQNDSEKVPTLVPDLCCTSANVQVANPLLDYLHPILWMLRNIRCEIWVRTPVKYVLDVFLNRHKERLENAWKIRDKNWFLGNQSDLYVGFLKLHINHLITTIVSLYRLLWSKITEPVQCAIECSEQPQAMCALHNPQHNRNTITPKMVLNSVWHTCKQ